jgi:hypothetical protein
MNPKITEHEWSLYIGFRDEQERNECLVNFKDVVRDHRYAQRAQAFDKMAEGYNLESPTAGKLQIFVSEAKNLPIDRFQKELSKNSIQLVNNRLQVRIGFKGPSSVADLFTSVFINESMIDSIENTLKKNDIIVEHDLIKDPVLSTEASPAGEMCKIGRLLKIPKSNPMLVFYICATVVKNGVEQPCVFGKGE